MCERVVYVLYAEDVGWRVFPTAEYVDVSQNKSLEGDSQGVYDEYPVLLLAKLISSCKTSSNVVHLMFLKLLTVAQQSYL